MQATDAPLLDVRLLSVAQVVPLRHVRPPDARTLWVQRQATVPRGHLLPTGGVLVNLARLSYPRPLLASCPGPPPVDGLGRLSLGAMVPGPSGDTLPNPQMAPSQPGTS